MLDFYVLNKYRYKTVLRAVVVLPVASKPYWHFVWWLSLHWYLDWTHYLSAEILNKEKGSPVHACGVNGGAFCFVMGLQCNDYLQSKRLA